MTGFPFAVFITATIVIGGVFTAVALSTRNSRHVDYTKANRLRLLFFASLGMILLIFTVLTLTELPYPVEARAPDRVVHAVGKQYAWSFDRWHRPHARIVGTHFLADGDRSPGPDDRVPCDDVRRQSRVQSLLA